MLIVRRFYHRKKFTAVLADGKDVIIIIIIIIIFIYLPSDVISQEKKLQLPLGLSPKHQNMQFL